jgi:hypothetical protein
VNANLYKIKTSEVENSELRGQESNGKKKVTFFFVVGRVACRRKDSKTSVGTEWSVYCWPSPIQP